jgi:predicted dinucleotide-binding enzyme
VKAGHEVMFSDRDAEQAKRVAAELGSRARAGSVQQAVAFGEAILIAVPYMALPAIRDQVGAQLKGKVVVDPNNPVPSRDGDMAVAAREKGAAVSTQALLPGTRLVRSFNSWGYSTMAREANRPAPRMALPVAADDARALKVGMQLVADAGFDPVNAGSLAASKAYDLGSPVSGRVLTAAELRQALNLKP